MKYDFYLRLPQLQGADDFYLRLPQLQGAKTGQLNSSYKPIINLSRFLSNLLLTCLPLKSASWGGFDLEVNHILHGSLNPLKERNLHNFVQSQGQGIKGLKVKVKYSKLSLIFTAAWAVPIEIMCLQA
jgi:hypothetical protein